MADRGAATTSPRSSILPGDSRTCKKCRVDKPLDGFPIARREGDKVWRRHACSPCYYRTNNKPHVGRVRTWLIDLKKTLKCNRCPVADFRVLDFHHLRDKVFNVSNAVGRGWDVDRIKEEIAKCEVLCANCHRIETFENRNRTPSSSVVERLRDMEEVAGPSPAGETCQEVNDGR